MQYSLQTEDSQQLIADAISAVNRLKYYCQALEKENQEIKKQLQDKSEEIPKSNINNDPTKNIVCFGTSHIG